MRCYVIDDEEHALKLVSQYVEQTPGLELWGTETNPLVALNHISRSAVRPEIIFLDIDMPQLSGMDLAGLIAGYTSVIFTTAYPDYAVQAFEREAIDYLLKPISYDRFLKAVERLKNRTISRQSSENSQGHFYIQVDGRSTLQQINYSDLMYVESAQNYVRLHLNNAIYLSYLTMKEVEAFLPPQQFHRIHRSYLVNLSKVKTIDGTRIHIGKDVLPLGSTYLKGFMKAIKNRVLKSDR
jgi:DNA-binding LytR/AlgR family response regulator